LALNQWGRGSPPIIEREVFIMNTCHDNIYGSVPQWFAELDPAVQYAVYCDVCRPVFRQYIRGHGDPRQRMLLSIEATHGLPFAMALLSLSDPDGVSEIERVTCDSLPRVRHKPLPEPGIHWNHLAGIEAGLTEIIEEEVSN
jgi:hypothetical protein